MGKRDEKENQPENDELSGCVESYNDTKKKKKHKKRKHEDNKSEDNEVQSSLNEGETKKKKKRNHENGSGVTGKEECTNGSAAKLKKKCRDNNNSDVINNNNEVVEREEMDDNGEVKKKKKKKKKKRENQSDDGCELQKKPKKKKKEKVDVDEFEKHEEISEFDTNVKQNKEKKKKHKEKFDECETLRKDSQKKCKRSKHKHEEDHSSSSQETNVNKKAKKEKNKERNVLKNGEINEKQKCLEDNQNKSRMNESAKLVVSKSNAGRNDTEPGFGQWSSADLGTTDRKQKFLRLLGGFKEPSTNQNKLDGVQMKLVNIAMGTDSQASYMNKLEEEYEKARDINIFKPKGVGLGYEPVPGRGTKLHINPAKSRSIKFDD